LRIEFFEEDKMISPFFKGVFGVGLGEVILLFRMETTIRGCVFGWHGREKFGWVVFLGDMGGRSLVVFQGKKVRVFFVFQKTFIWWCGMVWIFFSFIIWWFNEDIFSRKYFKQINVIFLGMKKIQHKIWNFNKKIKQYFV
jgi:hypothetical protein